MLDLQSVHHIAIIANDYEKSKWFYTEVLGLEVINEQYRKERASYKLDLSLKGKYVIELFSFVEYKERASYPEAVGLRHLAFSVKNVEKAIIALREKGILVQDSRIDEVTQKKFTFFEDPNGQPLELYEQ